MNFMSPQLRLRIAAGILFLIGGVNLVVSLLTSMFSSRISLVGSFDWYHVIYGVVFLILGVFTRMKLLPAVLAAIVLLALDTVVNLFTAIQTQNAALYPLLLSRVIFIVLIFPAVSAIQELQRKGG